MAGILNAAANKVNTDTAGHTYVQGDEPNPGQPVAGTLTETVRRLIPTASGALDSIFRMEPTPAPVSNPSAEVATSATKGPNGGLVPAALSHILTGSGAPSPGPGPQTSPTLPDVAAVATGVQADVVATAADAKAKGTTAVATLRRWLGV